MTLINLPLWIMISVSNHVSVIIILIWPIQTNSWAIKYSGKNINQFVISVYLYLSYPFQLPPGKGLDTNKCTSNWTVDGQHLGIGNPQQVVSIGTIHSDSTSTASWNGLRLLGGSLFVSRTLKSAYLASQDLEKSFSQQSPEFFHHLDCLLWLLKS